MKYFKRALLLLVFVGCGYVTWYGGMNYVGYCHKEGRFLSDEEKINSAVQFVLDRYPPSINKVIEKNINGSIQKIDHWYKPERPIKYRDVQEFRIINPDCCDFSLQTGEGMKPSKLDRIIGNFSTYVIVKFKVRYYEGIDLEKTEDSGEAVAVKNCGKSWSGL